MSSNKTRTQCLVALVCVPSSLLPSSLLPPPSSLLPPPSSLLPSSFPTRPPLLARGLLSLLPLHPLFPRTAHQHHPHLRKGTQPPQNMLPHCKHLLPIDGISVELDTSAILDCMEGGSLQTISAILVNVGNLSMLSVPSLYSALLLLSFPSSIQAVSNFTWNSVFFLCLSACVVQQVLQATQCSHCSV